MYVTLLMLPDYRYVSSNGICSTVWYNYIIVCPNGNIFSTCCSVPIVSTVIAHLGIELVSPTTVDLHQHVREAFRILDLEIIIHPVTIR